MRAQASFIVIIGILLLIAIVVYYASQGFVPSPLPPGVGEEQKMVQEMVEGVITSGTELVLKAMELQGGYLIPSSQSVVFTNIGVPYWQICQNDISPTYDDVKERFEVGIEYYVNYHIKDIKDFFGKNLSISNVSGVTVNIVDNKIDVSVHMPTRFQGYPIKQPYTISVPTKFKQLFNLAKDTIAEINKDPTQGGRFFETFTIASLYRSRYLPTVGFLTECGQSIRLTPQEISQSLHEIITYTITNFVWWQKMSDSRTYAVEYVNGKQYLDLSPMLFLPQGFEVTSSGSVNIQNNKWLSYSFPFVIPYCETAYDIKYSVAYPLVIKTNDPETGYDFNFAVYVNVDEMEASDCDEITIIQGQETCADLPCSANIRITDCSGKPLQGAVAYFGDCLVGESDSSGRVEGKILCGTHKLDIYYSGEYDYYSQSVSSTNTDGTYTLCKKPELTVYLNEVDIVDYGYDQYGNPVPGGCHQCVQDCPDPFTWERTECSDPNPVVDKCVLITFTSTQTGSVYPVMNNDLTNVPDECLDSEYAETHIEECLACTLYKIEVDNIPAGNYDVVAELRDPGYKEYVGYLEKKNFMLLEDAKELIINIPKFGSNIDLPEGWQKDCILGKLEGCGEYKSMEQKT